MVQTTARDGVSEIDVGPVGSNDWDLSEPVWKWNGPPGEVGCTKCHESICAQLRRGRKCKDYVGAQFEVNIETLRNSYFS